MLICAPSSVRKGATGFRDQQHNPITHERSDNVAARPKQSHIAELHWTQYLA